jgi:hypothetical protein
MSRVSDKLRDIVRERASNVCEYCKLPSGLSKYRHEVDHITAIRHLGTDDLSNLACACHQCNLNKGSDLASVDPETLTKVWLFNPRQDSWGDHFILQDDGYIVGKRPESRATIRLLQMNLEERVQLRRLLRRTGRM